MDLECVRLEYRLCRLLGDPALVCHGNADRILWDCQHVGIYFPDYQYAIKNYFYRNFGNLVLPDKFGTENFSQDAEYPVLEHTGRCAVRVDKALNGLPGVESAHVNYASATARVASQQVLHC